MTETEPDTKVEAALAVLFTVALAVQLATGFSPIGSGWDTSMLLGLALLFGISAALQATGHWRIPGR